MSRFYSYVFILVFLIGCFLRLYKLDKIPPSLNWDEVAAAYNAYTIKNWAKDEWGNTLPLVFTSFRDDKRPVHIYLTSLLYSVLGENDFVARFSSAILGIIMIPLFFVFGKLYFKNELAGLFSSIAIAFSTYDIFYSRGLWEAHFALFFLVLGLVLFKASVDGRCILYPLAYFSFGLSLISYHSSLVVVPVLVFLVSFFYIKNNFGNFYYFSLGIFVFLVFLSLLFWEPRLLGIARIDQNKMPKEIVENTFLYKKTGNVVLGQIEYSLRDYKNYFSYDYLFVSGSKYPRASMGYGGMFSRAVFLLALIGFLFLFFKKLFSSLVLLVGWFLLAPIPAAFAGGEPNATRAIFMLGPPEILAGFGFASVYLFVRGRFFKYSLTLLFVSILLAESFYQLVYFYRNYSKDKAIEWQYGMKEIVNFVLSKPEYEKVYMDNIRQQPYIFFLWYGKVPLPNFLESVKYEESDSKSFNTVFSFGRYQFGGWDWVNSYPDLRVLYVLEPYKYSGLRWKDSFDVVKLVKYPGGGDAFYLVSVF